MKRWSVLLGCPIGMAVSMGTIFWLALGLYLKPMTAEFGWSRTEFALAFSMATVANGLMLPMAGYFVDRFGPRRVILVGIPLLSASYAALSIVHSYSAFVALPCVAAATGSLASYPSYLALPPRWFDKNLGLALALASSGVGVGGWIFPHVISANLASNGWRQTFVFVGLIACVVGMVNFVVFIRDNKGSVPEAERHHAPEHDPRHMDSPDVPFLEAVRTFDFWAFSIGFGLVFFVTIGINFHFAALIGDRGGSPVQAASAVGALGMASLVGRLLTGLLLDRLSFRLVAVAFFIGQAAGCVLLLGDTAETTIAAAILLGLAQGAELDMMPFVIARRFGRVAYSRIFGSAFAVLAVGQIISPMILAAIFDHTGSYSVGLIIYPILSLVALTLVFFARVSPSRAADLTGLQKAGLDECSNRRGESAQAWRAQR